MSTDKWATSKSTQLSTKFESNCSFCLKMPWTQPWGPLTNWKFEPSSRPHTHSDPIINKHTEQVKKLCMELSWYVCTDFQATGQNSLTHRKARIWVPWLSKKISDKPTKTGWSWAQFQKGQPTPCKLRMLFPAHLWVREFWPQIYSLSQALDLSEAYCPKF